MEDIVLKTVLQTFPQQSIHRLSLYLHDVPESKLNVSIESLKLPGSVSIAYLPYLGGVNVIAETGEGNKRYLSQLKSFISQRYSQEIVSLAGGNLLEWVDNHFRGHHLRLGLCESCTGGLILSKLISRPGSSVYVDGGIVSYSNEAKEGLLDIPPSLLKKHGAVSRPVAKAMLLSLVALRSLDAGISVTGIAGPAGGSRSKPVGTVYIGTHYKNNTVIKKHLFSGPRAVIQEGALWAALNDLRLLVKKTDSIL